MHEELVATVREWITEAVALRAGAYLPDTPVVGPQQLREALLDVRARLDRVDELFVSCTQLRAASQRQTTALRANAEDQWDQVAKRLPAVEYQSGRERAAQINLHTVAVVRLVRQADEALSHVSEGYDVLRTISRGLDGLRMDLHRMLTAMTFESGLER